MKESPGCGQQVELKSEKRDAMEVIKKRRMKMEGYV